MQITDLAIKYHTTIVVMTVILNALKETQNANILSTPSILTLDNQEAYITVVQNVPLQDRGPKHNENTRIAGQ